mgnify:CR=1 FL=1
MGTFNVAYKPHKITKINQKFNTTIVSFENQREQRFGNASLPKLRWKFQWSNISKEFLDYLQGFHAAHMGAFKAWQITDSRLGAGAVTLRFSSDEFDAVPIKFMTFNLSLEVETC